ncbi:hypothetical protein [Deinococcus aestuarii]|uniref:hypothetical protein n=1 Tax=Deinococcus aestuarii TaxID=2774531 RepID=UPI001C0E7219|nr:hypothetical protein [Deinococcus aestuarii]
MIPPAAEVALAWEEAVNTRDEARLLALSDPEIEIVGPRGSAWGHAVLADWLGRAGLSLETRRRFGRDSVIVHGGQGRWHDPETDAIVGQAALASHYRVEGGQVAYVARYDDLRAALEHAGLDETDALT